MEDHAVKNLLSRVEPLPARESGHRLCLRLDFDGFEPDQGSLVGFVQHLLAKTPVPGADIESIARAAETVERIYGCNFWSAALVGLGAQRPQALISLASGLEAAERGLGFVPGDGAREALAGMLQWITEEKGEIVLADPTEITATFRHWLEEVLPPGSSYGILSGETANGGVVAGVRAEGQLGRLLRLIALCGDAAPVKLLLDFLGVPFAEWDGLLDSMDQSVETQEGEPALHDFEYRHPSFPGHAVYAVRDPGLRRAMVAGMPEHDRQETARRLYFFLQETLTEPTRGSEKLLLRLASGFPATLEAAVHAQVLSWWIDRDETGPLKAGLMAGLRDGDLAAEALWSAIERVSERWPVFRCLALLDVYAGSLEGAPAWQRGSCHLLRAVLRRREKRLKEAYEEACLAADFFQQDGGKPRDAAQSHAMAARTAVELRSPEAAKHHWERALDILEGSHGGTSEVSALRRNLADLAASSGDFAAAAHHQEEALRIEERLYGPEDPRVAEVLKILARFQANAGDKNSARAHLERVLEIDVRSLGEAHERTVEDFKIMASLLWDSGDPVAARRFQERALDIEIGLRGEAHPQVGSTLKLLAQWAWQTMDVAAARGYLERALKVERALSGERGIETGRVHQALEALYQQLGDGEAARYHGERARESGVSPPFS